MVYISRNRLANKPGHYKNFTGTICWKNTEGYVYDSTFTLCDKRNVVIFVDGVWVSGIFDGGVWNNGRWCNGHWHSGTWVDGKWYRGYDKDFKYRKLDDSPNKW